MPTAKILAGVSRFPSYFSANRALFDRLAQRQAPQVLFLTCSDSRIVPTLITGTDPGDIFVVRSIANVVPPFGVGAIGAGAGIEYALDYLRVQHIVLCGHTDCGGIRALNESLDLSREPHIARWLDFARPAKTKIDASGLPGEARHLATVRENVLLQLENLRSYDPVRDALREGTLTLHGWVYHLERGFVEAYDPQTDDWAPIVSEE